MFGHSACIELNLLSYISYNIIGSAMSIKSILLISP